MDSRLCRHHDRLLCHRLLKGSRRTDTLRIAVDLLTHRLLITSILIHILRRITIITIHSRITQRRQRTTLNTLLATDHAWSPWKETKNPAATSRQLVTVLVAFAQL